MVFGLDFYQEVEKVHLKTEIFLGKVLVVQKKAVPLHPLSRKKRVRRRKEESSLKDLHRQK